MTTIRRVSVLLRQATACHDELTASVPSSALNSSSRADQSVNFRHTMRRDDADRHEVQRDDVLRPLRKARTNAGSRMKGRLVAALMDPEELTSDADAVRRARSVDASAHLG